MQRALIALALAALAALAACPAPRVAPVPPGEPVVDADWGEDLIPPAWNGVEEAEVFTRAAGGAFLFPRPLPPSTDPANAIDKFNNGDGLYVHGSKTGFSLLATPITIHGSGRAGVIYDVDSVHTRDVTEDCSVEIVDAAANAYQMWGLRRYGLQGGATRRVSVSGVVREHGIYDEVIGEYTYEDVLTEDCGAQGIQLRFTPSNPATSPYWLDPKTLTITRCAVIECGLARGAGRAAFGVSIKALGPNATVLIDGLVVQTVNQTAVKVYNGKTYDSFGALLVEFCDAVDVTNSLFAMKNPDRDAIQFFNYGWKGQTGGGPRHIRVKNCTLRRGNTIVVREGDGESIDISGCTGDGWIRVLTYQAGTWRVARTVPIEQGYSWSK